MVSLCVTRSIFQSSNRFFLMYRILERLQGFDTRAMSPTMRWSDGLVRQFPSLPSSSNCGIIRHVLWTWPVRLLKWKNICCKFNFSSFSRYIPEPEHTRFNRRVLYDTYTEIYTEIYTFWVCCSPMLQNYERQNSWPYSCPPLRGSRIVKGGLPLKLV